MTDYATNAAKEIRSHIREFGANAGMSAHSLGVITDIIHRHRSARERELEAALKAASEDRFLLEERRLVCSMENDLKKYGEWQCNYNEWIVDLEKRRLAGRKEKE